MDLPNVGALTLVLNVVDGAACNELVLTKTSTGAPVKTIIIPIGFSADDICAMVAEAVAVGDIVVP